MKKARNQQPPGFLTKVYFFLVVLAVCFHGYLLPVMQWGGVLLIVCLLPSWKRVSFYRGSVHQALKGLFLGVGVGVGMALCSLWLLGALHLSPEDVVMHSMQGCGLFAFFTVAAFWLADASSYPKLFSSPGYPKWSVCMDVAHRYAGAMTLGLLMGLCVKQWLLQGALGLSGILLPWFLLSTALVRGVLQRHVLSFDQYLIAIFVSVCLTWGFGGVLKYLLVDSPLLNIGKAEFVWSSTHAQNLFLYGGVLCGVLPLLSGAFRRLYQSWGIWAWYGVVLGAVGLYVYRRALLRGWEEWAGLLLIAGFFSQRAHLGLALFTGPVDKSTNQPVRLSTMADLLYMILGACLLSMSSFGLLAYLMSPSVYVVIFGLIGFFLSLFKK